MGIGQTRQSIRTSHSSTCVPSQSVVWRCSAAWALGELGDASEPVIQALRYAAVSESTALKSTAEEALEMLNKLNKANPALLLQDLDSEYVEVRLDAAELGKLGKTNDSIRPLLVQWIEQHQDSEDVGSEIDVLWQIEG